MEQREQVEQRELDSETIRLKDGTEVVLRRFEDLESGAIADVLPPDLSPEVRREAMNFLRERGPEWRE